MKPKKLITLVAVALLIAGCASGPSAQELAGTMVAKTAAAVPPTNTPVPVPTDTPVPPTVAVTPTITVTPTPSGPLVIKDDFSSKSSIWGTCDKCDWHDGKLYYGPYAPNGDKAFDQVHALVCVACGSHTYFHISADISFVAGQGGDRLYGLGRMIPGKALAMFGITPFQFGTIEVIDLAGQTVGGTSVKRYGSVKAGSAVNHMEFDARPNSGGSVDYFALVNGKTVTYLPGQVAEPGGAGFYLEWHSVGIAIDNFEYDEVVP